MDDAKLHAPAAAQDTLSVCSALPAGDALSVCSTLPVHAAPAPAPVPKDFLCIPVPRRLRHRADAPAAFSLWLNILFAVATTFIVANIYWCQPILIELAEAFDVSYERVSNVPTLMQAGYAAGLLLIAPLGDLVRRRPLILALSLAGTALTFGVAFTSSFAAFQALSFLIGVCTCVPQILVPLAADLAPPARRARAISIVLAGLLLGILLARVLAGLVAQFAPWRVVYYLALGLQAAVFVLLYALLPDFPALANKDVTYAGVLLSMARFAVTEPLLVQASLVCFASMACFTNFWVTLTFLLGGAPYFYSTLVIGLFGLVGIFGVLAAPLVGRLVDGVLPWAAAVLATLGLLVFQGVQTGAGGVHIAAVIVVCFGIDVFRQMQQVALTSAVFALEPRARSRLNAVILIAVFAGQIMGTAVGTQVFVRFGWRPAAALSVAWSGFTLLVMLARGPHCARYTWVGYEGGCRLRRAVPAGVPGGGSGGPARDAEADEATVGVQSSLVDEKEKEKGAP
ncbi:MFS general substrate transporter [Phanerochaete sordida]|uniref:MFS general substrate transporter n=1 Tax=Phanerochaete sordida TaxID=48140 RepID=A0A9P3LAB8_9APHY|nr:MFS general substrate transporter [Phanerochaete sordida]